MFWPHKAAPLVELQHGPCVSTHDGHRKLPSHSRAGCGWMSSLQMNEAPQPVQGWPNVQLELPEEPDVIMEESRPSMVLRQHNVLPDASSSPQGWSTAFASLEPLQLPVSTPINGIVRTRSVSSPFGFALSPTAPSPSATSPVFWPALRSPGALGSPVASGFAAGFTGVSTMPMVTTPARLPHARTKVNTLRRL